MQEIDVKLVSNKYPSNDHTVATVKISSQSTVDELTKLVVEAFKQHLPPNSNSEYIIQYYNTEFEQEVSITTDDGIELFLEQVLETDVPRDHKTLLFKTNDDVRPKKYDNDSWGSDSRLASDSFMIRDDDKSIALKITTQDTDDEDESFDSRLATDSFLVRNDTKINNETVPKNLDSRFADSSFHIHSSSTLQGAEFDSALDGINSFKILTTSNNNETTINDNSVLLPTSSGIEDSTSEFERVQNMLNSQYEQLTFLASGGFGTVYSAIRKGNQKKVAIKIMKTENQWKLANSALKEFEKMVKLYHEHIVKTYRAFFVGEWSSIGIEMELMCGSLMDFIQKKQVLNEKVLLKILKQCCQALEWIEKNHNVVHRDIKPQNILTRSVDLNENEINVALADFGLARTVESVNATQFGGTNNYFSPEVISNQTFSFASDVFALGVTIYQLMTFDMTTVWSTMTTKSDVKERRRFIRSNMKSLYSDFLVDLIVSMLDEDTKERMQISQILEMIAQHEHQDSVSNKTEDVSSNTTQDFKTGQQFYDQQDFVNAFKYFERAAIHGSGEAQYYIGEMYHLGQYTEQNDAIAFEWFEKSANSGHIPAQHRLINLLRTGTGIDRDYTKSVKWLEKCAAQGDEKAQLELGLAYSRGEGINVDFFKAAQIFEKLANQNNSQAQYELGVRYELGQGVPFNTSQALQWYLKSANQGNVDAQFKMGSLYNSQNILGIPTDQEKAFAWFEKAAQQGHVMAQFFVGAMYDIGSGVPRNVAKALEWKTTYEMNRGNTEMAQQYAFQLAQKYQFGDEVPQDLTKSAEWLQKASQLGNNQAQYLLGLFYLNGQGMMEQNFSKALEYLEKSANQNNEEALLMLGTIYHTGQYIQKDLTKAIGYYEKAAMLGHSNSQFILGSMYLNGQEGVVEKNFEKAAEWFEKSANQGNGQAQISLAALYEAGLGVEQDYSKSLQLLETASMNGLLQAKLLLGIMYLNGSAVVGGDKNEYIAFNYFEEAAEQGHAQAQNNLALMYRDGIACSQDFAKALEWSQKAAIQGHANAQAVLGQLFEKGSSDGTIAQDLEKAFEWYSKSADQGDPEGQFLLGKMYFIGQYVTQDSTKAREYTERSALQGYALAQASMGYWYFSGQGVQQDLTKARIWYEMAANQGNLMAQINLAVLYLNEQFCEHDDSKARQWLEKAALQGHDQSQFLLGQMYEKGQGLPQPNFSTALEWYEKAADQGYSLAEYAVSMLYEKGSDSIPQDQVKALEFCEKAAEHGHIEAQYNVARMYESGIGTSLPNLTSAFEWYEKAANQGHANSQFKLALLYARGYELYCLNYKQDAKKAIEWLEKAALQEHLGAQYCLAKLYFFGKCNELMVDPDYAKALFWFEKASTTHNHEKSQRALGFMYSNGLGLTCCDYSKALEFYEKSAIQGNIISQYSIGLLYECGHVGSQDNNQSKALEWYEKAANQGHTNAQYRIICLFIQHGENDLYSPLKDIALQFLEEKVSRNDEIAQFILGFLYQNGVGTKPQDYVKSMEWFETAAHHGNVMSAYQMGLMYRLGIQKKYVSNSGSMTAMRWFEKADDLKKKQTNQNPVSNTLENDKQQFEFVNPHNNNTDTPAVLSCDCNFLHWYQYFALDENDNIFAQYHLANMYYYGIAIEIDYTKALQYFEKAASHNHEPSLSTLGLMYQNGQGTSKDNFKAIECYEKSSQQGNANSQFALGFLYEGLYGPPKDLKKACEWYEKAAENNISGAQNNLGLIYQKGSDEIVQDLEKAFHYFEMAAHQGEKTAQYQLALCYKNALGTREKNYEKAMEWFQKCALQWHPDASYQLGLLYLQGLGIPEKDELKAVECFEKAARDGHADAAYELGRLYDRSTHSDTILERGGSSSIIPHNQYKAFEWYLEAAEYGHVNSMFYVAQFYDKGLETQLEKDLSKAFEWYVKGAQHGHALAQYHVGLFYLHGKHRRKQQETDHVEQDNTTQVEGNVDNTSQESQNVITALEWLEKSALQGNDLAEFTLGQMFEHRLTTEEGQILSVIEKDELKAMEWYEKSAQKGNVLASDRLAFLREKHRNIQECENNSKDTADKIPQEETKLSEIVSTVQKTDVTPTMKTTKQESQEISIIVSPEISEIRNNTVQSPTEKQPKQEPNTESTCCCSIL